MFTVHLVHHSIFFDHAEAQKALHKSTEVVVVDNEGTPNTPHQARVCQALSQNRDVVAIVPASSTNPAYPVLCTDWVQLADEVITIRPNSNRMFVRTFRKVRAQY